MLRSGPVCGVYSYVDYRVAKEAYYDSCCLDAAIIVSKRTMFTMKS